MIYFECDRCSKPLPEGEGYSLSIQPRFIQLRNGMYIPNEASVAPFAGEICAGCHNMLNFVLKGRFVGEDKPVAGS